MTSESYVTSAVESEECGIRELDGPLELRISPLINVDFFFIFTSFVGYYVCLKNIDAF